jgi:hypothetical protein
MGVRVTEAQARPVPSQEPAASSKPVFDEFFSVTLTLSAT